MIHLVVVSWTRRRQRMAMDEEEEGVNGKKARKGVTRQRRGRRYGVAVVASSDPRAGSRRGA
jgi:hypothetical protein